LKILICGASGFVGRHLTKALKEAGHTVVRGVRRPRDGDDISVDYCKDTNKEVWLARLKGINIVVNAVGVLRDSPNNPMQKLHDETPSALFEACAETGVERIVHLSALGVESGINVPYFTTRVAAERALQSMPPKVRWLCLRPSLIYGEDGESSKMFRQMAKLPVQALPMGGKQGLQPVHIDDICSAVTQWLDHSNAVTQTVDAVGAEATTMRGMLDSYRQQMHYRPALHLAIPSWAMSLVAKTGDYIPSSPMCSDTLQMLSVSNTADVTGFAKLLKHAPRGYREFII
jgi:uncharacterized protein YbjT (DUF2867 family)